MDSFDGDEIIRKPKDLYEEQEADKSKADVG
jgi:hypothetical protein